MGESAKVTNFNEQYSLFFASDLLGESDLIYRLAFSQVLNKTQAFEIVKDVYRGLIPDLNRLITMEFLSIRRRLFQDCLKIAGTRPKGQNTDRSVLASFIGKFTEIERSILIINELGGFKPKECAELLSMEEFEVRKSLAIIRKSLISFSK